MPSPARQPITVILGVTFTGSDLDALANRHPEPVRVSYSELHPNPHPHGDADACPDCHPHGDTYPIADTAADSDAERY